MNKITYIAEVPYIYRSTVSSDFVGVKLKTRSDHFCQDNNVNMHFLLCSAVDQMGRWFIAGGAAVGLGALCYYGLGMSNEIGAIEKAM